MGEASTTQTTHTLGDLVVETTGDGRPVLLIHGNGENHDYFAAQVPVLAERRRVIAPDTRAHGRSRRGGGPLTIARLGQDAADVIEAFSGTGPDGAPIPCDVIGFSDGANIAIELALARPDLVRSLVLNAGNLDPSGLGASTVRVMRVISWALRQVGRLSAAVRTRQEVFALMVDEPQLTPDQIGAVTAPTLVLVGERDIIDWEHTKVIAASIPGARLVRVPKAGHTLLKKMPEVANPILTAFLDSVDMTKADARAVDTADPGQASAPTAHDASGAATQ